MPGRSHDEYEGIRPAAAFCLSRNQGAASKPVSSLKKMLKTPNPGVQAPEIKALARLRVTIPRKDLLPWFTVPRMDVTGPAVALLRQENMSCEQNAFTASEQRCGRGTQALTEFHGTGLSCESTGAMGKMAGR
jgi:hypothetical protein